MATFDTVKKIDNYQYAEGCPVFITGGNLLKKLMTDRYIVSLDLEVYHRRLFRL